MGCDIHQYAEKRVDGVWVAEQASSFTVEKEEDGSEYVSLDESGDASRNYFLFGLLSDGVRFDCPYAFEPKTLPEDLSSEVSRLRQQWEGDAHSDNYLTFKDLGEKMATFLIHPDPQAREWAEELGAWIDSFGPTTVAPEDRRVVFWFDN